MDANQKRKTAIIILMLSLVTVVHYIPTAGFFGAHIFHRELFFFPIVLTGMWFGLKAAAGLRIWMEPTMKTRPKTMHGVQLIGHGGLEMLDIRRNIPVPAPGPGDVLVAVAAAAVNNTDINTRTAWYSKREGAGEDASWSGRHIRFPRIQGADVCGYIAAVGAGVGKDRIGERVLIEPCLHEAHGRSLSPPWYLGSECDGGFAEFVVAAGRHAWKIDSSLTDVELTSFPCSYSTAENLLARAGVKKGEHVLVTGASGGVGSAAVQLAKARGARVATITSTAKSKRCETWEQTRCCREKQACSKPSARKTSTSWSIWLPAVRGRSIWRCCFPADAMRRQRPSQAPWCNWM